MAGSTAARSPSGERARRRASRDGAVPLAPPGHHGQWPSPPRSVEREGGGENDARVWGAATATRFCSGENRGRPSDRDQRPRERLAFWAGKRPMRRGRGRRDGPFRRPGRWLSGLGPKERWPSGPRAGFLLLGRLNSVSFYCFSIIPEAISIVF